jgi:hypothetical protein
VGYGQLDFRGTIKTVLGTVQGLVNLSQSSTSALGRSIDASEQTVLAAIAALPTAHLSVAEQHQVADETIAVLVGHGVQVDDTALLDALSTRLPVAPGSEQGDDIEVGEKSA